MNSPNDNDSPNDTAHLRRLFETDQKFGQIAATLQRARTRFAPLLVLIAAWGTPIYYALAGIPWTPGGGHRIHPEPATWAAANRWATTTLWGGAAAIALLITACLAYSHINSRFRRPISPLLLIQQAWTWTALIFIAVIYNALVMAR